MIRRSTAALFLLAAVAQAAETTGVVVAPNGAPVRGARVAAYRPMIPLAAVQRLMRGETIEPLASATTGEDGRFALNVAGAGIVDLRVIAEGFAPAETLAEIGEADTTVTLQAAATVTGTVTGGGKPLAGATVAAVTQLGAPLVLTTDAAGHYRLPDPDAWRPALYAWHPDFAPEVHHLKMPDFALEPGQTLRGKVLDAKGHPATGAVVEADQWLTARSGDDGTFTIPHAPPKIGGLRARAGAMAASTSATSGTIVLQLAPAFRVSGVVRDAEKRPLSGITIILDEDEFAVSDGSGGFVFEGLRQGKHGVMAYGGTLYVAEETMADASAGDAAVTVLARRLRAIDGVVRDEERKPVAAAAILTMMLQRDATPDDALLTLTRVVTGPDGHFRVRGEAGRGTRLRVVAMKQGMPPAVSQSVERSDKRVELVIPRGVEISGTVVGPDDKPLAGVKVNPVIGVVDRGDDENTFVWLTTDAHGAFRGRLTAATKSMTFAAKGYVGVERAVEIAAGMKPLAVKLAAGAAIRGRVTKKDGTPFPHAFISTSRGAAESGVDGTFVLEDLEPGPQELMFGFGTQMQQTVVKAPATDVELVMPGTRAIHGRVIDGATGAPVRTFMVSASESPEEWGFPKSFFDENGEFTIDGPEGRASLTASADGYPPVKGVLSDPANPAPVVIKFARGRTVRGRVIDVKGNAIAGVSVSVDEFVNPEQQERPQSGADGAFELRGIALDDDTTIQFNKDGYVTQQRRVSAGRDDATLEVTMAQGLTVTGRVLDSAGKPVAEIPVSATSAGHDASAGGASTDEAGAFRIDGLTAARYDFEVEMTPDGERGAVRDVDVGKTREIVIRLEKTPTATIFGHVSGLAESERELGAVRYVMVTATEGGTQSGQIDASGNYRIANAPAGLVEVQARSGARGAWRESSKVSSELRPGAEARIDLAFQEQIKVSGRVTRGGAALADARVQFVGGLITYAMTGADGTYEFALDPGDYDVGIWVADRRAPFTQHVVVRQPAQLDFRVDPATVTATVIDAETAAPVAGASVTLAEPGATHTFASAKTGADGVAAIEVQAGVAATVVAARRGYANATENVTVADGAAVTLRLQRAPGAVVRVVDMRDGRTLSGYVVARDSAGRVVASTSETDSDGTVTLPLAAGAYRVSASAEGYGSHTVSASVPSGEVRVPLPRGGNLTLRASRDVRGKARLIQPDGEEYVRCWCSGIAEIEIEGPVTFVDRISPGAYVLEVTLADSKPRRIPISVVEGQTTSVPLE